MHFKLALIEDWHRHGSGTSLFILYSGTWPSYKAGLLSHEACSGVVCAKKYVRRDHA